MQPDVHLRIISADEFSRATQLFGQLLACGEAAVNIEEFRNIYKYYIAYHLIIESQEARKAAIKKIKGDKK